jgi:hypothetical protein
MHSYQDASYRGHVNVAATQCVYLLFISLNNIKIIGKLGLPLASALDMA